MPFINLKTNVEIKDKAKVMNALWELISIIPGKTVERTMVSVEDKIAMGFAGSEQRIFDEFKIEKDARTNIKANDVNYQTSNPKVFAAGDARRGQSLVVWAIAEGRKCAREIDEYLMGYSNL